MDAGSQSSKALPSFPMHCARTPRYQGTLYAGLGDGTILRGTDAGAKWEQVTRVASGIEDLTAVFA